jgi:hypothetical protein
MWSRLRHKLYYIFIPWGQTPTQTVTTRIVTTTAAAIGGTA